MLSAFQGGACGIEAGREADGAALARDAHTLAT